MAPPFPYLALIGGQPQQLPVAKDIAEKLFCEYVSGVGRTTRSEPELRWGIAVENQPRTRTNRLAQRLKLADPRLRSHRLHKARNHKVVGL